MLPKHVVLDANILIAERLLRSSAGAALLWALKRTNVKLLLPEFTKYEAVNGLKKHSTQAIERVVDGLSTVRVVTGSTPRITLPTDREIDKAITARFDDLKEFIHLVEPTKLLYDIALHKVVQHLPPSDRSEQFRDMLLWEVITASSDRSPIRFATADKAFYKGNSPTAGLAPELMQDLKRKSVDLQIYPTLELLIEGFGAVAREIDLPKMEKALLPPLARELAELYRYEHAADRLLSLSVSPYLTEEHRQIAVIFSATYDAEWYPAKPDIGVYPELLKVEGEAFYHPSSDDITDLSLSKAIVYSTDNLAIPGASYGFMSGSTNLIEPYQMRRQVAPR